MPFASRQQRRPTGSLVAGSGRGPGRVAAGDIHGNGQSTSQPPAATQGVVVTTESSLLHPSGGRVLTRPPPLTAKAGPVSAPGRPSSVRLHPPLMLLLDGQLPVL